MKYLLPLALLFGFSTATAQLQLSFCAAVDPQTGYCVHNNTRYFTSPDSTTTLIYIKVHQKGGLKTTALTYKAWSVSPTNEEKLFRTWNQDVRPEHDTYWQYEFFPTPAKYLVRVYDAADKEIATKSFEVREDW